MTLRDTKIFGDDEIEINKEYYPYFSFKKAKTKSKGTFFFIHGYAFDSSYNDCFANQIDEYDYYAIELPGHGITPVNDKKDLCPIEFAKMTKKLIEELDLQNIHLIGHSMGGGIAMMVNNMISERIKSLILVCPMNSFGTTNVFDFLFNFNPKNEKQIKKFYQIVMYDKNWINDPWAKFIIDHLITINIENAKWLRVLKMKMASLKNIIDLTKSEYNLKNKEMLLILGKHDKCINPLTTKANITTHAKNAKVILFEKSGHIPMFEELGKFTNEILKFISK